MCLLVESIKIKDGIVYDIEYHNRRMNETRFALFGAEDSINLAEQIIIPETFSKGLVKCRVLYNLGVRSVEFQNYSFRKVEEISLITDDEIDYTFKYADRKKLEYYANQVAPAIPLFVKNNRITDTSWANIVLYDGTIYSTPAFPLLKGTKREKLIQQKRIIEEDIKIDQLVNYNSLFIINAMIDLEDNIGVPISKIKRVINEI
jgi:4-amino-4-deoxychorismate lyase